MKMYFVASISGKSKFLSNYQNIIEILRKLGHEVSENTLTPSFEFAYSSLTEEGKSEQYKKLLKEIGSCETMVAEVSYPSLRVGFEISLALQKGKSVILLYCEGNSPQFLEGADSEKMIISKYSQKDVEEVLREAIKFSSETNDSRFNFFLSKKHMNFLDLESHKKKIPKSVYLRELLETDMKNNSEFQKDKI